jgi:hypothetical protein
MIKKIRSGNYNIEFDTSTHYGEWDGENKAGSLWFEGRILSEYDGYRLLPEDVIKGLKELGCIIPAEFE